MPLARNVGQQREKLSALVAREFDRPVIRVPSRLGLPNSAISIPVMTDLERLSQPKAV